MNDACTGGNERERTMREIQDELPQMVESKWQQGQEKYGDAWLDADPWYCLDRMEEEFYEYRQAVVHHQDSEAALAELADLVNYGLMFAVLTGLYDTDTDQEASGT